MSLTTRILVALVAGLGLGAAVAHVAPQGLLGAADLAGALWLNALRMTIVPLVFAMLFTSAATAAATSAAGGLAARALAIFVVLLLASSIFGATVMQVLLAWIPIEPTSVEAIRAGLGSTGTSMPTTAPLADWLRGLVPANPLRAAVEDAMVPLVVFALLFGFAASRTGAESRQRLVGFFQAVTDTMLVLVHWVLLVGPIGIFALAFALGVRVGLGAAGALVHYVLLIVTLCVLLTLSVYLFVVVARIGLGAFARAAVAAQAVAFSTQSSLAALPAMVEGAQQHLKVPARVTGLVLPLAVTLFRYTSPAANIGIAIYLAALYGLEPSLPQVIAAVCVAAVVSLGAVSLPGQVSFFTSCVPICMALGVPLEALPLLLAVEAIPDIFRTVGNVTADLAVAAYVGRHERG
jgi:Na+/H+-dicarboxylate symporter